MRRHVVDRGRRRSGTRRAITGTCGGTALAVPSGMKNITEEQLATVSGGMRWEDFRPSENVEDRRGMTPWQSMHAKSRPAAPLPPLQRTPDDLSHQAGLDDIKRR